MTPRSAWKKPATETGRWPDARIPVAGRPRDDPTRRRCRRVSLPGLRRQVRPGRPAGVLLERLPETGVPRPPRPDRRSGGADRGAPPGAHRLRMPGLRAAPGRGALVRRLRTARPDRRTGWGMPALRRAGHRGGSGPDRAGPAVTARTAAAAARDTTAELAFATRALKAPTLRDAVPRLVERARAESVSYTHLRAHETRHEL